MTWANLQMEVLEQFCAPEWFGLAVQEDCLSGALSVVNDDRQRVARKADTDATERTLEVAASKVYWRSADLAAATGESGREGATRAGLALRKAGWTCVNQDQAGSRAWLNAAALAAQLSGDTDVVLADAAQTFDMPWRLLAVHLRAAGWTSRYKSVGAGRRVNLWNPPTVTGCTSPEV